MFIMKYYDLSDYGSSWKMTLVSTAGESANQHISYCGPVCSPTRAQMDSAAA